MDSQRSFATLVCSDFAFVTALDPPVFVALTYSPHLLLYDNLSNLLPRILFVLFLHCCTVDRITIYACRLTSPNLSVVGALRRNTVTPTSCDLITRVAKGECLDYLLMSQDLNDRPPGLIFG